MIHGLSFEQHLAVASAWLAKGWDVREPARYAISPRHALGREAWLCCYSTERLDDIGIAAWLTENRDAGQAYHAYLLEDARLRRRAR